jgi:hypothetical protein
MAQSRPRHIVGAPLKEATDWLEKYREFWEEQFDRLDKLLEELKLGTANEPGRVSISRKRRKKNGE